MPDETCAVFWRMRAKKQMSDVFINEDEKNCL